MTIYSIYKFTNLVNGKVYIGKTINDPSRRLREHELNAMKGSETLLHYAIRKYGIDSFSFEIIFNVLDEADVNYFEIRFIKEYNCSILNGSNNGYNMTFGGDGLSIGFKHSDQTKLKMSKTRKGTTKSVNHKAALSKSKSGSNNPMHGRIGKDSPCYGKVASAATRKKQSDAASARKVIHKERTCPHCLTTGKGGAITRYHFDNCKKLKLLSHITPL